MVSLLIDRLVVDCQSVFTFLERRFYMNEIFKAIVIGILTIAIAAIKNDEQE